MTFTKPQHEKSPIALALAGGATGVDVHLQQDGLDNEYLYPRLT